jgi:hypothetical protein
MFGLRFARYSIVAKLGARFHITTVSTPCFRSDATMSGNEDNSNENNKGTKNAIAHHGGSK